MGRLLLQPRDGVTRSPGFRTTGTSHSMLVRLRTSVESRFFRALQSLTAKIRLVSLPAMPGTSPGLNAEGGPMVATATVMPRDRA